MVLGAALWMPCGMSYLGFAGKAIHVHVIIIISLDNKKVQQSDRLHNCINSQKLLCISRSLVKIK